MNLNVALVCATSKARKGASQAEVRRVLRMVDPNWEGTSIKTGLVSGEGLIEALTGTDKRLLAVEEEFARVLKAANHNGNVLSDIIRQAWDGTSLSVLTRRNPLHVEGARVSVIGHIIVDELRARMSVLESRSVDRVARSQGATKLWCKIYGELLEGKSGRVGAITARAEAQVVHLACLYALLDSTSEISIEVLEAALDIWRFCVASAEFLFAPQQESLLGYRIRGN
jgi:uncharacterized protein DUF3987